MTSLLRLLAGSGVLLLGLACSSEPTAPETEAGAGGQSGTHAGGKSGSAPQTCPEGTNPRSAPKPVDIGTVTAQFVDENGEPTPVGRVQVCGVDICRDVTEQVSKTGKLAKVIAEPLDAPACKFGNGVDWAELALPLEPGDSELGTLMTARLPDVAGAEAFAPGKTIASGGVSLTLAAGAVVSPNTLDYETEELQQAFRAVALPEAALAQLKQDFVVGFGLSPLETRLCPSPSLKLENSADLAPGTELELYVLGLSAGEEWVPYASWQKASEGQVSADGATLDFPEGVPLLTAIGVRVKP